MEWLAIADRLRTSKCEGIVGQGSLWKGQRLMVVFLGGGAKIPLERLADYLVIFPGQRRVQQ